MTGIETLQEERKRSVYRLCGALASERPVIAKRCRIDDCVREQFLYTVVLPRLSLAAPVCHGMARTRKRRTAWLFIEDLSGDEPYDPASPSHREMAAAWMARLHTSACESSVVTALPRVGPQRFSVDLHDAMRLLRALESSNELDLPADSPLPELSRRCRTLANRWPDIEGFCESIPKTLVHGDVKEPHVFYRRTDAGCDTLVLDWAECGWGVPAIDVAKFLGYSMAPSLDSYCDDVHGIWPDVTEPVVVRLGFVGEAFRCIRSIRWELEKLKYGEYEGPLATLSVYAGWLADIERSEPWNEHPISGPAARRPVAREWY